MKRFLILMLLLWQLPVVAEPPDNYPFVSFDKAMQQSMALNKPIFVYFGRYGCGYCDKTNKEAFSDPHIKQTYTQNYVLAYIDSESGKRLRLPSGERITEREVGTRYNAFVTPVFSFLKPDGDVLLRLVGVQRIEDFINADQKIQTYLSQ